MRDLFDSFAWGRLWQRTGEDERQKGLNALLLAGWWKLPDAARDLLGPIRRQSDTFQTFAAALARLSIGFESEYHKAFCLVPYRPQWPRRFLEVSFYGRKRKSGRQIELAKSICKGKIPPDWLYAAFLFSLSDSAGISGIKKWLADQPADNRLHLALRLRLGEDLPENIPEHPAARREYIIRLIREQIHSRPLFILKILDQMARDRDLDMDLVNIWIGLASVLPQAGAHLRNRLELAWEMVPDHPLARASIVSNQFILDWKQGDLPSAHARIRYFLPVLEQTGGKKDDNQTQNRIFIAYCGSLAQFRVSCPALYEPPQGVKPLVVLGESHSLSVCRACFTWKGEQVQAQTCFVRGIKMYHLARPHTGHYAFCLSQYIERLKHQPLPLLFTIGEIDCRPDEGIWKNSFGKRKEIAPVVEDTVCGYMQWLTWELAGNTLQGITVQGIPAPLYELDEDKVPPGHRQEFLNMIRLVNQRLGQETLNAGFSFLDVYRATAGEDGRATGQWHIDPFHLRPDFYARPDLNDFIQQPE